MFPFLLLASKVLNKSIIIPSVFRLLSRTLNFSYSLLCSSINFPYSSLAYHFSLLTPKLKLSEHLLVMKSPFNFFFFQSKYYTFVFSLACSSSVSALYISAFSSLCSVITFSSFFIFFLYPIFCI